MLIIRQMSVFTDVLLLQIIMLITMFVFFIAPIKHNLQILILDLVLIDAPTLLIIILMGIQLMVVVFRIVLSAILKIILQINVSRSVLLILMAIMVQGNV